MKITVFWLCLFGAISLFGQKFPRGLPEEPDTLYKDIAQKATLTDEIYRDVKPRYSLKQFTPYPGWQDHGTCAAFATAYAARTILEAQKYRWTDRAMITSNVFSPGFIYRISNTDNTKCWGAYTSELLNNMVRYGVPKNSEFPTECPGGYPQRSAFDKAATYKIRGFVRLFGESAAAKTKVTTVKKSLSEGNPVVISMICPNSFDDAAVVWNPTEDPGDPIYGRRHGRHALCVVGYDDEKYGGAFEILNSWGKSWGNNGFIWMRYTDFARFIYQGFEVLNLGGADPIPDPEPEPIPKPVSYNLNGELRIMNTENVQISAGLIKGSRTYRLREALPSGSRFRLYLKNTQPAFVYLLGWDNTNTIFQLFPHDPTVSPALTYSKNEVAIPGENHHVRLDNTAGKDVMALIYSKKALNINEIKSGLRNTSGSIEKKLIQLLGADLAPIEQVTYESANARFSANNIKQPAVLVLFEIDHK